MFTENYSCNLCNKANDVPGCDLVCSKYTSKNFTNVNGVADETCVYTAS